MDLKRAKQVCKPAWEVYRGSSLRRLIHPRPTHVLGVGTARSGTHSITNLFKSSYYAYHEPEFDLVIPCILEYLEGRIERATLIQKLQDHDRRWYLTVEVAHYFGEIAGELVTAFPEARFIVTIRDCYTWLQSQLSQILAARQKLSRDPRVEHFIRLNEARFGAHDEASYSVEEHMLREMGLPPIDALLRHWTKHNEMILREIPESRRLVVRTGDINASIGKIAAFVGVPVDALDASGAHSSKRQHHPFNLWQHVDREYIEEVATHHCSTLMQAYFPEIDGVDAALAVRQQSKLPHHLELPAESGPKALECMWALLLSSGIINAAQIGHVLPDILPW